MATDSPISKRGKSRRTIPFVLLLLVAVTAFLGYRYYNKPAARAEDETAIPVSAAALARTYTTDTAVGNRLYLDKWIAVSGRVSSSELNQAGQSNIFFGNDEDPLAAGVSCMMRDQSVRVAVGDSVTLKGRCTGMPSDVTVTDCILVK